MTKQFNPGRVRKVVETITTYVPEEAPTLAIDMEESYSVQVEGEIKGVDSLQVSGKGKPVRRVDVKGPTRLEAARATKAAYAHVAKSGGIDQRTVEDINVSIETYNEAVCQYRELTGREFRDVTSEVVLNTEEAAADLERRL